jgi:HK97 family phage major capsid protein
MDIDISDRAPESKAGISGGDRLAGYDEVMHVFEEFRQANDERLAALERHGGDVVSEEKVDRINTELSRRIDELSLKHARPVFASERSSVQVAGAREHKSAFDAYLRNGESAGLRQLEQKAMSTGSNPDGGYTVPVEIERAIGERLTAISPIRQIAGQRRLRRQRDKKPS